MELKDIKASCEAHITLMQETLQSWGLPDDTLEPMEETHLKVAWDEYNRAADPYLQDIRHLEQHWLFADIAESLRTIAAGTIPPTVTIDGMELLGEHTEKIEEIDQTQSMHLKASKVQADTIDELIRRLEKLEHLAGDI